MCCLLSSMAIKFEKKTNTYFHSYRNTKNICWDFTLAMGLVHGSLHFTRASPKSKCTLYFTCLLRLKSWDLFTRVGLGTRVNRLLETGGPDWKRPWLGQRWAKAEATAKSSLGTRKGGAGSRDCRFLTCKLKSNNQHSVPAPQ